MYRCSRVPQALSVWCPMDAASLRAEHPPHGGGFAHRRFGDGQSGLNVASAASISSVPKSRLTETRDGRCGRSPMLIQLSAPATRRRAARDPDPRWVDAHGNMSCVTFCASGGPSFCN
jgi:hypothetical protein